MKKRKKIKHKSRVSPVIKKLLQKGIVGRGVQTYVKQQQPKKITTAQIEKLREKLKKYNNPYMK